MQTNLIFIIGYMGVGKTTLGKSLAKQLNYTFIDLDQVIESKFEITINSFFEQYGETAFRDEETKVLKDVINLQNQAVVAVGGGLPCFNENMKRMNEAGYTCYLHRPVKELFQRLKNSKKTRPLIKNLNDKELLSFIERTIKKREPFYSAAHFKIGREQQNVDQIKEILKNALR